MNEIWIIIIILLASVIVFYLTIKLTLHLIERHNMLVGPTLAELNLAAYYNPHRIKGYYYKLVIIPKGGGEDIEYYSKDLYLAYVNVKKYHLMVVKTIKKNEMITDYIKYSQYWVEVLPKFKKGHHKRLRKQEAKKAKQINKPSQFEN